MRTKKGVFFQILNVFKNTKLSQHFSKCMILKII